MLNERMMVLNMVDEGVITVGQALELLEAMFEDLVLPNKAPAATIQFSKFCLVIA